MKFRGPFKQITPRRPTPLVVPLVDVLPQRSDTLIPEWLRPNKPAAPQPNAPVDPIVDAPPATPIDQGASLQEVLEDARAAAEAEGLRMAQEKVEELMARYIDAIDRLSQAIQAAQPSPAAVVDLALVVAAEIIGREATVDRDLVVHTIDQSIAALRDPTALTVRVGTADYQYVTVRRPDLIEAGVKFIEDPSLRIADCVVETPLEVRDSTVSARLNAVREGLIDLVRGELENGEGNAES